MAIEKITSLQVAKRAGVSQSAVSRVFTPGASASAKTAKAVKKAADELGYRPNMMARAMITGKSRIIGLVVAYLDNQFYPLALERLSNALQEQGYHILVFTVPNDSDRVAKVMRELLDYQVDGIITASVSITNDLTERCAAVCIPIVMFNRAQDGRDISAVTSANVAGGRKVAQFLIASGYKRNAHISGWQGSSTGRDRLAGFREGMRAAGMPMHGVIDGHFSREVAAQATRDLMKSATPPDAIFVGNDHMAFAVMDTLRLELGLRIPEDIAVVGYDDVPLAQWASYDLTTVRQPVNQMVEATIDILLSQINNDNIAPQRIEIDGPLMVRGSAPGQPTKDII
jgi:DNA-binding LacI/PurR family transcriptional regulator